MRYIKNKIGLVVVVIKCTWSSKCEDLTKFRNFGHNYVKSNEPAVGSLKTVLVQ